MSPFEFGPHRATASRKGSSHTKPRAGRYDASVTRRRASRRTGRSPSRDKTRQPLPLRIGHAFGLLVLTATIGVAAHLMGVLWHQSHIDEARNDVGIIPKILLPGILVVLIGMVVLRWLQMTRRRGR